MRDWRAFVTERLGSIRGDQAERQQIESELAQHLEEYYDDLRTQGVAEKLAFVQTCARVGDWKELRQEINSARQEGTMTDRVQQIWLPTLVTLVLAAVVLTILAVVDAHPVIFDLGQLRGVMLYVPWLLLLPVVGAIGAYLSRRAQGTGWRVYVSGLSPALAWGVVLVLVAPFAFLVNPAVAPGLKVTSILAMVVSWVVVPGIALGIGIALQGLQRSRTATSV
jgi:hypothetical protein